MSEKPFFSVIIPAYNSAAFIRKGLESIREQSFTDYELIVICDKCEDNTAEICREYTDKVKEIDHDADGPGVNIGLDMARGEWVLFMDDDDWWLHEVAFEMIHDAITEISQVSEIDVLAFGFWMKGVGLKLNTKEKVWPATWNKAWKREFIGETRFEPWKHSNDLSFAMQLHPKARFAFLYMPFYYYNFMRPGSVSDRIKKGELTSADLPEVARDATDGYTQAMRSGTI